MISAIAMIPTIVTIVNDHMETMLYSCLVGTSNTRYQFSCAESSTAACFDSLNRRSNIINTLSFCVSIYRTECFILAKKLVFYTVISPAPSLEIVS